jgi:hypothetical protein
MGRHEHHGTAATLALISLIQIDQSQVVGDAFLASVVSLPLALTWLMPPFRKLYACFAENYW